jgi:hypothetical protein
METSYSTTSWSAPSAERTMTVHPALLSPHSRFATAAGRCCTTATMCSSSTKPRASTRSWPSYSPAPASG